MHHAVVALVFGPPHRQIRWREKCPLIAEICKKYSPYTVLNHDHITYYIHFYHTPLRPSQHTNQSSVHLHNQVMTSLLYFEITRMWANAQRDGRPAEYRWRPLFKPQSLADAHY